MDVVQRDVQLRKGLEDLEPLMALPAVQKRL